MDCSVAIQYLPMDAANDDEVCRVVDAVIAHIAASGLSYYVGPFETTIEGPYEVCMDVLRDCQLVGAAAGCKHVMTLAKINYRAEGDVLSTERKISKYHTADPEFSGKAQ